MKHLKKPHIIDLPKIEDPRGNLSFIEEENHIPFKIKRVYWIYDVPGGQMRGGHAFKEQHEFIVALSGSFDVVKELEKFGCDVDIYDPWADPAEVKKEYDLDILPTINDDLLVAEHFDSPALSGAEMLSGVRSRSTNHSSLITNHYNAIVLAVSHDQFKTLDYPNLTNGPNSVTFDIKGVLPGDIVDSRV